MKNVAALWQMQTEVLAADCRHGNPAFSPIVKTPVFCRGIENIENDIESRRGWTCSELIMQRGTKKAVDPRQDIA